MLDIKFVRENPEIVIQNIRNKFQEDKLPLVDEVIELDAKRRAAQQEGDDLRSNRKKIAKQIETDIRYPGRIKLTMIRETRIIEYAR